MTNEKREDSIPIDLSSLQSQSEALVKGEIVSDIQIYRKIIGEKLAQAKTVEECNCWLNISRKIQELDIESRKLDYAEKVAEAKLKEAKQRIIFKRSQQVVASVASITIGLLCLQNFSLVGLIFLILGLTRPLGYSLGEISVFSDRLKGFPKDLDTLSDDKQQKKDSQRVKDAKQ